MAPFRESQKEQVLVRMSRSGTQYRQWGGYGTADMKNSTTVPQNWKIELLYQPAITLPGIYSKEKKLVWQRDVYVLCGNPSTSNT